MYYPIKRHLTIFLTLMTLLALTGCQAITQPTPVSETPPTPVAAPPAAMTAGALRAALDQLLGEHVLLAASATNAALHSRDAEFKAAAAALDGNSQDLAMTIGAVYGEAAGKAFLPLWRKHIGFFVDYTNGVAKRDKTMQNKALMDLTQYAEDFGAFLESANPNLPKAAVVSLLVPHVNTLTAVINAQAQDDHITAYTALRTAYAHMDMVAGALAGGIAKQFPEQFTGAVDAPGAGLRSTLTQLLSEHVYVAAMATNAALDARDDEFKAAASALDGNSQDLAAAIGSVYGEAAGTAFLPLWRKHIGFFVDYTNGAAQGDQAAKDKAISDLTQYAQDFGAFLESANPNLPKAAVVSLLVPHVQTLTAVIDAQAAKDPVTAYTGLRAAYAHMPMVANALTDGIIQQFPDKFTDDMAGVTSPDATSAMTKTMTMTDTGAVTATESMTGTEMMTGTESMTNAEAPTAITTAPMLRANLDMLLGEHVLLAASATEAALRGRQDEFAAAAAALDGNSVDVAATIGAVYGDAAQAAFLPLWRKHIGFFVDYTTGLAKGDKSMQDKAVADLTQYADDFGAFLESANPNLPKAAVANLLRMHAQSLLEVINDQAMDTPQKSGDQLKAYPALETAYAHMDMFASALASAIAKQFPDKFPGDAQSPAADLRSTLNLALGEHTYLVAKSAAAALAARDIEYEAAFASLDKNSQDLAAAIGSIYGDAAGKAFLPLWRKHIGFFVDYSLALIQKDEKARQKAVDNLTGYAADFGAFLNSANPNLPAEAATALVKAHAISTLQVLDAGADQAKFYTALRAAYAHMPMIANPLADAIIVQFPDKFGTEADLMAQPAVTDTMTMSGTEMMTGTESSTGAESMTGSTAANVTVMIKTFMFMPARIEVPVGGTVAWLNQDGINHTVTSGTPEQPDGVFDSGPFNQGAQFSFTFTKAGEYPYFCGRHNEMRGVIVVTPAQ